MSLIEKDAPPLAQEIDRERAENAVRDLLAAVGEDTSRRGLRRTPERVADLFITMFSGVGVDPASALGAPVLLDDVDAIGDVVGLTGIRFSSLCEHHLLPFEGTVDIWYAPREHLAGLSRLAAAVEVAARRPQLQERLGSDLANAVMAVLRPHGVCVRIEATHGCVSHMEPRAADARAVTIAKIGEIAGVPLETAEISRAQ